jgi:16S rRNA G966 N2-methylase RsmD
MLSIIKKITGITGLTNRLQELKELEKANQLRLDELNWANVFNSAITDSKWLLKKSFYPGRWAAGYPLLYLLYRIYNDVKPKSILEFGLGESSKLAYQYQLVQPQSNLIIVEQDKLWLDFFSNEVYNVTPNTLLLPIEKKNIHGNEVHQYVNLIPSLGNQKFDLIVVDGPWGSNHFSRYQIIDLVENGFLAETFMIIVDDVERVGEQETVAKLREILIAKQISFVESVYSGAKQSILICSPIYKFLTSL